MYTYILGTNGYVLRSDGAFIPADPLNMDYASYLDWVAAGNTATLPLPSLADAQATQIAVLSAACADQIISGFSSNALGVLYSYPSKVNDQSNLNASVTASLYANLPADWVTPFWCADSAGEWAFRQHTAAQIQQVGTDAKTSILGCMGKNETLAAQVRAATTVAQVQAIVW